MREYLFELHMHTSEVSPCGKVPAKKAVRMYHDMGYDGVCITDHFYKRYFERLGGISWKEKADTYLKGFRAAREEGSICGVSVVLGMEYSLPETNDDILIYGFDEDFLYNSPDLYRLSENELKALAIDYDLLLIQAHPCRKEIKKIHDTLVEGFEAFNGNRRHDSANQRAEELGLDFGGILISGSDFHEEEDAGTGGVYLPKLPADSYDLAGILREVKTPGLNRDDRVKNGRRAMFMGR
jgi:predicted metal-dependent phosphoesterase TrpH